MSEASCPVKVSIVPHDKTLVRASKRFSCGHPVLDQWLTQYSGQNERRHNTRTFFAVASAKGPVVGYYTLVATQIEPDPEALRYKVGTRDYPVPAVLLARLAVDKNWQGCRIGAQLLAHALKNVVTANDLVGFEALVVDAIDQAAETFYSKHGFIRFEGQIGKLFLPVKLIRETLASGSG